MLTRYPKEGQPISILEAMGNGMVIITTDHAGIPDIVKNETNGFVFKILNIEDIYNCICKVSYKEVLLFGRENTKKFFVQEFYINNMLNIFKAIVS